MKQSYSIVEYHSEKGNTGQPIVCSSLKEAQKKLKELRDRWSKDFLCTPINCGKFTMQDKHMPIALDVWKYVIEYTPFTANEAGGK